MFFPGYSLYTIVDMGILFYTVQISGKKNRAFVMSFNLIRHRRSGRQKNGTVYKEYLTIIPIYSISYIPDT